jgi:tetratricopeptide (TPR) repeat protein
MFSVLLWFWLQAATPHAAGLKALETQDYPAAVAHFQQAVAQDPDDYGAHFHLALALSLAGQRNAAIDAYRKVLELKPGLYEAELNLGILLLDAKRAPDAMPLLAAAVEKKPDQFRPRFYLAEACLEANDLASAERHFQEAARLDPKAAAAALGLGRTLARQKRLEEAAPYFRRAADLDPGYRDALLELAALYEQAKYREEAIAIYRQFPELVAARERIGQLLLQGNQAAEAIPELERAVERDPTAANRAALADAYRRDGQPGKALEQLQRATAAEPRDFNLRMTYGILLREQKRYAQAAREFGEAARLRPDSKEAWSELAGMLTLIEDFPQALAALDRVAALGAETPGHLFFRAIILDKTRQYQPALDAYQRFLAAAAGKFPDEEFQARQRIRIIKKELSRR